MGETLDRDELLDLLGQLSSAQDSDVLAAARALQAKIDAAGLDWDDLVIGDVASLDDGTDTDGGVNVGDPPSGTVGSKDAKTLALIDKLLARPDCSDGLREELIEYKTDIAEGVFETRDHDYVHALYKRLTK